MNPLTSYTQFESYIYDQLPRSPHQTFTSTKVLQNTSKFLQQLNNPQNQLKIIHIAGTSGKGSTAHIIAQLLKDQGYKVGLHISPHITDIRERFQILTHTSTNTLLDKSLLLDYFNKLKPYLDKHAQFPLTYFEFITCFGYFIFNQQQVDYAVIETGLGGMYDATNVIHNPQKLCVITPIDFDHMHILGNSIKQIATQKAGIITPHNHVISAQQHPDAQQAIQQTATQNQATLQYIENTSITIDQLTSTGTTFHIKDSNFPIIKTNLIGLHQTQNIALALQAIRYLAARDNFIINPQQLINTLQNIKLKARIQIIPNSKNNYYQDIIIDSAHNPHKITSLINTLTDLYPQQKFTFLLAFKSNKEVNSILQLIKLHAHHIILTSFTTTELDYLPDPINPHDLAKILDSLHFPNYTINPDPQHALRQLLSTPHSKPLVITGSFYLISTLSPQLDQLDNSQTTV